MCVNNGDASGLEFFRHKTYARAAHELGHAQSASEFG